MMYFFKKNVQIMYGTYIEFNFKYTNLLISAGVLCRKPSKDIENSIVDIDYFEQKRLEASKVEKSRAD